MLNQHPTSGLACTDQCIPFLSIWCALCKKKNGSKLHLRPAAFASRLSCRTNETHSLFKVLFKQRKIAFRPSQLRFVAIFAYLKFVFPLPHTKLCSLERVFPSPASLSCLWKDTDHLNQVDSSAFLKCTTKERKVLPLRFLFSGTESRLLR